MSDQIGPHLWELQRLLIPKSGFPFREHKAVVHQAPSLRASQRVPQALAHALHGGVGHAQNKKLIHHHGRRTE